jgi:hypothetical protein
LWQIILDFCDNTFGLAGTIVDAQKKLVALEDIRFGFFTDEKADPG